VSARLLVVGLGRIGLLHAANLSGRVPGAELAGVVDAVERVACAAGEEFGVPSSTSLGQLLSDTDGVVIAAPTSVHAELVERAAAAGKHVFCEKPLGFDIDAACRAVAAVRAAGVALQVGFQRRFDPDWLALREALVSGQLGRLELFRGSHRNAREPAASADLGGLFVDVAIHDLDAARWLAAEVAELHARERRGSATISLRFESGALGLIDVSRRAGYGFECSAELVGSRGTARARRSRGRVELLRDGLVSAALPADHARHHEAAYVAELEHFGQVVLGGEARGAGGDDAVAALKLALLARRSAALGAPVAARSRASAMRVA
jgi:myo-inositol 2-dehydrogenase/D-chiro-inositol 1-dehydrogenase